MLNRSGGLSFRWKLALSFVLVILLTMGITLVLQRAIILPRWEKSLQYTAFLRNGAELEEIISSNLPRFRNWVEARPLLDQLSLLFQVKIFLTDGNGELRVQSRYPEGINPSESEIDISLGGQISYAETTSTDNKPLQVASYPLYSQSGLLGVLQIAKPLEQGRELVIFPFTSSLLLGSAIAALLSLLLAFFLSRGITLPISKMKDVALRFSRGDFKERVGVQSADELGELARALNSMASSLEQVEQMRRDLLANISHEIRTPLATIKGYLEALADGMIGESEREATYALILSESQRLEKIVNSILELSRLESGQIKMEVTAFPIKEEFERLQKQFQLGFERKGVDLTTDISSPNLDVLGDSEHIHEVLENLLDNALQYTNSEGLVRLFAKLEHQMVRIGVQDNGVGISASDLPHIFERFYRADKSHSRETGGTGLGLSIARQIIVAHGQNLEVQSELGKGSCFFFFLPLAKKRSEHGDQG